MENSEQALATFSLKDFTLFVTNTRLAFIKNSSGLAGAMMGGALGGMIGGMIGGALQRKIGSRKQQSVTMDELLKKDEKNYAIAYDELDAITFNRSKIGRPVKIVVCSNTGKKLVELELNHNAGEQIFGVFSKISALNGKIIQQTH